MSQGPAGGPGDHDDPYDYEDLAWDGSFLSRADYSGGRIVRITRTTGAESTFIASVAGPVGVAYASSDKTFWVASFSRSELYHFNASGSPLGNAVSLSLGSGFRVGGLAYDPSSGTLWVGSDDRVFHISKSGQLLGFFNTPEFGNAPGQRFVDGLEFELAPR